MNIIRGAILLFFLPGCAMRGVGIDSNFIFIFIFLILAGNASWCLERDHSLALFIIIQVEICGERG